VARIIGIVVIIFFTMVDVLLVLYVHPGVTHWPNEALRIYGPGMANIIGTLGLIT